MSTVALSGRGKRADRCLLSGIAQISEPDTDKTDTNNDTYIPVHPGATAYFGGNVQSFFDKHGDQIFYGSMLLGTLASHDYKQCE